MENDLWNYRQQALASILFDRTIDPLVRRLLVLAELSPQRSGSDHGLELERRNQVKQLLHTLRLALGDIEQTVNTKKEEIHNHACQNEKVGNSDAKSYWQSRILNQINGIAVPLFGILRRHQHQHEQLHNSGNVNGQIHYVLQSAAYSCMEEAALSTIVLWKCRSKCATGNNYADKDFHDKEDDMNSLLLPGLVSCTMALSSLDVANNDGKSNIDEQVLDRGEECAVAILRCMQFFFTSSLPPNAFDLGSFPRGSHAELQHLASPMATEIGNAMGGALVARLVQTCLTLLPAKESEVHDSSGNNDHNRNSSSSSNKDNPTLQLEALKTLQVLMTSIPIETRWQAVLPGCFAGLYRCALSKLRYSSSASTHKVASEAIFVLSLLLMQSMKNTIKCGDTNESSHSSVTESLLAAVQKSKLQVNTPDLTDDGNGSAQMQNPDLTFCNEVNSRLPGPLSVLLSLVSTNRSHLVRQRGLFLCRVILIETRSTWTESTTITLGKKALEYCLTVLTDEKDKLSDYSTQILNDYKSQLGATEWKRQLSQHAVPTILELVEMLPILSKSRKDVEVRDYLKIIDGYLLVSFQSEKDDGAKNTKKRKSDIAAALSCAEAAKLINDAFSVIFVPDTESMTCKPVIEAFSVDGNEVEIAGDRNRLRFLYLQDETINAAKQTIWLLARTFGTKRSAFIIDACIADIFESCSQRCQSGDNHVSGHISARLTWSGSCVYCTELLEGLKLDERGKGKVSRSASKFARVLSALASSVYPVIVSEPLWTLPTTDGHLNRMQVAEVNNKVDHVAEALSITVMNANSLLLCALMDFVCQFAQVLGQEIKQHLPIILLPLLERASGIGNHALVQNVALSSLGLISRCAGCSDLHSFIATNFDYVLDAVSIRVRKHAKERSIMPRSMMGVIGVVLQSAIRHETTSSCSKASHLSMVDYMLTCLLNYFDRQYDVSMTQQSYLDMVWVFRAVVCFVDQSIVEQTGSISSFLALEPVHEVYGMQRLDDELKLGSGDSYNDPSHDESSSVMNTDEDEGEHPNIIDIHTSENKGIDHTREIHTVNSVLARCSYLVCSENLKIQVLGCETILAAFNCLWKIGAFRSSRYGESASNPLLPAIAELWPTIIRRLRTASSAHVSSRKKSKHNLPIRHVMAKDQDQSVSQTSLVALISKCLEIISQLCIISDGFFSDRFENDVYPILAKLFESEILFEHVRHSRDTKSDSLILSVLLCLKHTFGSSCGKDLAGLIPSLGNMIFPMLSDDQVGDAAVETLKVMLQTDSDSLWRGLHSLSGRSFPRNPLHNSLPCSSKMSKFGFDEGVCNCNTTQRAEKLLYFIENLPEQQLC